MIGAIAGDIIGSVHEFVGTKTKRFDLFTGANNFTDDTVLTVAVAEWLLRGGDLVDLFHEYYQRFPAVGYGGWYRTWAEERRRDPYDSYGNGSAMRVSPVGWAFDTLEEVLDWAKRSSEVTHNHPEGIRGAQATAACIFVARTGGTKDDIRKLCDERFVGYNVDRSVDMIRPGYRFDVTCQGSVPESISCVLDARDYEDTIRNAVSLGGDADTQACIAGGIAEAMWGVPEEIATTAMRYLDPYLEPVVTDFIGTFVSPEPRTGQEPVKP